ncbi:hypothetical protein FRC17_007697, partial [Serendipita sp. 399]
MTQRALFEYEDGQGIPFCVHKENPRLTELVELIQANGGICTPEPIPGSFCIFFQAYPTLDKEIFLLKGRGIVATTIAWIYESIFSRQLLPWYQYQIGVKEGEAQIDASSRDLRELSIYMARHSQMFSQPDDVYHRLARKFPHRTSSGFRDLYQQHRDRVHSMMSKVAESIERLVHSADFLNSTDEVQDVVGLHGNKPFSISKSTSPTASSPVISYGSIRGFGAITSSLGPHRNSISSQQEVSVYPDRQTFNASGHKSSYSMSQSLPSVPQSSLPNRYPKKTIPHQHPSSSSEEEHESDDEADSSEDEENVDDDESFKTDSEDSDMERASRKRKRAVQYEQEDLVIKRRRINPSTSMRSQNAPAPSDVALMYEWLKKWPIEKATTRSGYWKAFAEK